VNRERIFNTIGFGLIGLAFVVACFQMVQTALKKNDEGSQRIIVAHWQLESGLREAFDVLSEEYRKLHPGVQIVQLPVPERIYTNWLIAKLVGEEAPDLIQLGFGINNDRLARFFVPLGKYVEQPNPYNEGTELEGVPWRDTFLDGLLGGYNGDLLEYYGVGLSLHTVRLFYNRDVFEQIRGADAEFPQTYDDFLKLCRQVEEYSLKRNSRMVPIAGSQYNSLQFSNRLATVMTQTLTPKLDDSNTLTINTFSLIKNYNEGDFRVRDPALQAFLSIMRDIGRHMTPGFMSLRREDSSFAFIQQRAFCVLSGSWDIPTLKVSAEKFFRVGIAKIPIPSPDDPVYGQFVLGPVSEANVFTGTNFGITRQSKNFDRALDFLRFITSKKGIELFAETSSWLPSVVGAKVPERILDFVPELDGNVPGPVLVNIGSDTKTAYDQLFYSILLPEDGVAVFTSMMEQRMEKTVPSDARRLFSSTQRTNQSVDVNHLANLWRSLEKDDPVAEQKATQSGMRLIQSIYETLYYAELVKD
jgi:raffinose/stachyose/melibiose transport system substrate-binding protein